MDLPTLVTISFSSIIIKTCLIDGQYKNSKFSLFQLNICQIFSHQSCEVGQMRNCIFLQVYVTKFNIELTIVSFSLALWSNIHSDIFCKIVASHFKLNSSIIQTISRWVCICFAGFIWMEGVYGNLYHASDSSCACCCWCQFRTDLNDSNSRQFSMDLRYSYDLRAYIKINLMQNLSSSAR